MRLNSKRLYQILEKEKKIVVLCSRHVPYKTNIRTFHVVSVQRHQTNKQTKRALSFSFFKTEPIAFLLFSMPFADV